MKTIDKYLKEADTDEHLAQYIRARNRIKIHIKNIVHLSRIPNKVR